MTEYEKILWSHLKTYKLYGYHFRRQHPYGIYILDFFCFKANLSIELDGPIHLEKMSYDQERTKYITSTGVTELRFKNEEILNKPEEVLKEIRKYLSFEK